MEDREAGEPENEAAARDTNDHLLH
jgi:hypothetical protein